MDYLYVAFRALAIACLSVALPTNASAQEAEKSPSYLSFGIGAYNVSENGGGDIEADFRVEYRSGYTFLKVLHPFAGLEVTSDASAWVGAGIVAEIPIGSHWFVGGSFAPGAYVQGNSDLDLNHPIGFRSQAEIGYRFGGGPRVSLAFSHTSNAGLDDDNPGVETIALYYHFPF